MPTRAVGVDRWTPRGGLSVSSPVLVVSVGPTSNDTYLTTIEDLYDTPKPRNKR